MSKNLNFAFLILAFAFCFAAQPLTSYAQDRPQNPAIKKLWKINHPDEPFNLQKATKEWAATQPPAAESKTSTTQTTDTADSTSAEDFPEVPSDEELSASSQDTPIQQVAKIIELKDNDTSTLPAPSTNEPTVQNLVWDPNKIITDDQGNIIRVGRPPPTDPPNVTLTGPNGEPYVPQPIDEGDPNDPKNPGRLGTPILLDSNGKPYVPHPIDKTDPNIKR